MTTPHDPIARLREADPIERTMADDPTSSTASRVFERSTARAALEPAPEASERRFRASRALPVLAAAAAVVAVVGLSLPKGTPGPVRDAVGSEQASATSDRAVLLRAARHQAAAAEDETAAEAAGHASFMADLSPYPEDPTDAQVLAWLDQNCDKTGRASSVEEAPGLDCGLAAVPEVLNEGPPAVAADVLRAMASLDTGSPTHAERCADWASVDPAWKQKVEAAEADLIWVTRNGTRLSVTGTSGLDVHQFSAVVTKASPESSVFVQCKPTSELADHPELTVTGAGAAYTAEHSTACVFGTDEDAGLVPVDLAASCGLTDAIATGAGEDAPSAEDLGDAQSHQRSPGTEIVEAPDGSAAGVITTESVDPNAVSTTVGG